MYNSYGQYYNNAQDYQSQQYYNNNNHAQAQQYNYLPQNENYQGHQPQQNSPQQVAPPQTQQIVYVTGVEEVKNYPIDWTGGVTYFVDNGNLCIYSKQIGGLGLPEIKTYKLQDNNKEDSKEYVTREEFEEVKSTLNTLLTNLGGNINE